MTAECGLKWFLRFLGVTTIPAAVAAAMPQSWVAFMIHHLEPDVPIGIVVTYLFRMVMLLYAALGVEAFFFFAADIRRYLPLIWFFGVGTVILAVAALTALFAGVAPEGRNGLFWLVFFDFADGLVKGIVLVILLSCVSCHRRSVTADEH